MGSEPIKGREEPNFRCVVYLCYLPRSVSDEYNLDKKRKAFQSLRTTNHYASKAVLFPKMPRTYGGRKRKIKQIDTPVLSELGLKLAGF